MEELGNKWFNEPQKIKDKNIFSSLFWDLFKNSWDTKKDSFGKLFKDLFSGKTDNFFWRLFDIFLKKENIISNTKKETQSLRKSLVWWVESIILKRTSESKENSEEIVWWVKWFLAFIRKNEASDNYNAVNWQPNQSVIDFTNMSIKEVLDWQDKNKKAVWAYQFKRWTLRDLCKAHNIDLNNKFSPDMQDKLAKYRLEYRWLDKYRRWEITIAEIQKDIAKEWAIFPKDESWRSYYRWVGSNKAHVSHREMRKHLEALV